VLDPIGFGLFDFLRAYLGLAGAAQMLSTVFPALPS